MINHNNSLYVSLSDSTSDLIERYADLDAEGYICNFHIINKEIIKALHSAKEWLEGGMLSNEELSEVWTRENPCAVCEERGSCNITCRRKHAFDREVYGGLLCGIVAAANQRDWHSKEVKNKVHFKVRFAKNSEGEGGLFFERDCDHSDGAVRLGKKGEIWVNGERLLLRPWSAALYTLFVQHPEGLPLAAIAQEHSKEFVRIYKKCSQSEVKVEKLKAQLSDKKEISHLLNNKLSELNTQLKAANIAPLFWVTTTSHKANLKPYYIPYLRDKK